MADPAAGAPPAPALTWRMGERVVRWTSDGVDVAVPFAEPLESVTAWHDPRTAPPHPT